MQILTIAGTVGKDAVLRDAGGDKVLNFSLAVDNGKDKNGEKRDATWFDCALWGKRGESLERHVTKGSKLTLMGRPTVRVHEGKAYLGISVNELTFMGSPKQSDDGERFRGGGSGAVAGSDRDDAFLNDPVPF